MSNDINTTQDQAQEEREKYVMAFNKTMVDIWKERITLLDVRDTDRLLNSPIGLEVSHDGRFCEVLLTQEFLEYGLWQDFGVGKETPRGNSGDLGHAKVRQRRPWFSKKYYASVMNIREFMADNLGREFVGVMSDVFAEIRRHM